MSVPQMPDQSLVISTGLLAACRECLFPVFKYLVHNVEDNADLNTTSGDLGARLWSRTSGLDTMNCGR